MSTFFSWLGMLARHVARKGIKVTVHAVVLLVAVAAITIGLLYGFKIFWYIFVETNIGRRYVMYYPGNVSAIYEFLQMDILLFAVVITVISFVVCQVLTALCQLLHIARCFYLGRGLLVSLIFWGLPLTAVVAAYTQPYFGLTWEVAYGTALIPTLCLFMPCISFSRQLFPEIGEMMNKMGMLIYYSLPNRWKWSVDDLEYELETIKQVANLTVVTAIFNSILLIAGKKFWPAFTASAQGESLLVRWPELAVALAELFSRDAVGLAVRATIITVLICMAGGAVCQVLHILRKLYIPRGFVGRIIFWALPLAAAAAAVLRVSYAFDWLTAYAAALIPVLILHSSCLNCTYVVLPEAGELLRKLEE